MRDQDRGFFVYGMVCESDTRLYIKLGMTTCITKRLRGVQTGCPLPIHLVLKASFNDALEMADAERRVQAQLHGYRSSGEWFCFDKENPTHSEDFDKASDTILNGKAWERMPIQGPGWRGRHDSLCKGPIPPKKLAPCDVMSLEEFKRMKRGLEPNFWVKG